MKKTLLKICFRILISAALIYWLMNNTNLGVAWNTLKQSSVGFFMAMYAMVVLMNFTQVFRWFLLTRHFDKKPKIRVLIRYHMVGVFFQTFLPSSMSAELIKGAQLSKGNQARQAFGSVVFGKIAGVTVLLGFVLLVLLLKPEILVGTRYLRVAAVMVLGLAVLFGIIFSKKISRALLRPFRFWEKSPLLKHAKAFREELYRYRESPVVLFWVVCCSVLILACTTYASYFSFRAVSFSVPILVCAVYFSIIYFLMLIPISINGIGVREGLLLMFFGDWGLTEEVLISSSLLAYFAIYSFSLLGGGVYLLSGKGRED